MLDELSIVVTGPADASSLAVVSRWCEDNDVLPESLTLGQRNLEDVFLELTGRALEALVSLDLVAAARVPHRSRGWWPPRRAWRRG